MEHTLVFFRQNFRIILPPLNTWLCILMFMIVWGWPPGQSDLVLLSGHSISFLLISDSSKYTKLKSTHSNMYHHDHFCLIVMMMMRMIILAGLVPGAVFIYCWSLQIWLLYDYSIHRDQWRGGPYQCPLKGTKRSQKNISMITSYCSLLPIPPPKRDVRVSEKPPFSLEHKNTNRSNETRTKKNAQLQIDGICTLWIIFYSKRFCAPKGPAEIPIAPCEHLKELWSGLNWSAWSRVACECAPWLISSQKNPQVGL